MTAREFWRCKQITEDVAGNAFARVVWKGSEPREIWPLYGQKPVLHIDAWTRRVAWEYSGDDFTPADAYPLEDLLHFKGPVLSEPARGTLPDRPRRARPSASRSARAVLRPPARQRQPLPRLPRDRPRPRREGPARDQGAARRLLRHPPGRRGAHLRPRPQVPAEPDEPEGRAALRADALPAAGHLLGLPRADGDGPGPDQRHLRELRAAGPLARQAHDHADLHEHGGRPAPPPLLAGARTTSPSSTSTACCAATTRRAPRATPPWCAPASSTATSPAATSTYNPAPGLEVFLSELNLGAVAEDGTVTGPDTGAPAEGQGQPPADGQPPQSRPGRTAGGGPARPLHPRRRRLHPPALGVRPRARVARPRRRSPSPPTKLAPLAEAHLAAGLPFDSAGLVAQALAGDAPGIIEWTKGAST